MEKRRNMSYSNNNKHWNAQRSKRNNTADYDGGDDESDQYYGRP